MKLGETAEWLNRKWGCACIGGPRCCRIADAEALALRRAAHIAIKQIADYAAAREAAESEGAA